MSEKQDLWMGVVCLKNRKHLVVFQFRKLFPKTFSWTQRATENREKESTLLKKILPIWGVFGQTLCMRDPRLHPRNSFKP